MNRIFFVSFVFLVLISCSAKDGTESIINKDTFVDVLVDIHLADATLIVAGYRPTRDSVKIRLYYSEVLAKHHVTPVQLKNTIEYYTDHPRKFEKIYSEVSEKVLILEESIKKEED